MTHFDRKMTILRVWRKGVMQICHDDLHTHIRRTYSAEDINNNNERSRNTSHISFTVWWMWFCHLLCCCCRCCDDAPSTRIRLANDMNESDYQFEYNGKLRSYSYSYHPRTDVFYCWHALDVILLLLFLCCAVNIHIYLDVGANEHIACDLFMWVWRDIENNRDRSTTWRVSKIPSRSIILERAQNAHFIRMNLNPTYFHIVHSELRRSGSGNDWLQISIYTHLWSFRECWRLARCSKLVVLSSFFAATPTLELILVCWVWHCRFRCVVGWN